METIGWIIFVGGCLWILNIYLKVKHIDFHDKITLLIQDYWNNLRNYFK
tara:strand:- start:553 stop:699 length:147 start_codon:yes stop_codon:yes gene_type:complete